MSKLYYHRFGIALYPVFPLPLPATAFMLSHRPTNKQLPRRNKKGNDNKPRTCQLVVVPFGGILFRTA
jgi:hypothetical protein